MIYYVIFVPMLFFCIIIQVADINRINTRQVDKVLFFIFSVVLVVVAAIRDNVGLDYKNYQAGYQGLRILSAGLLDKIFNIDYFEPLYNLLNIISPSFRFVLIVSAGLGVLAKVIYYSKTNTRLFCLFLYYCSVYLYYDMGIIRQGISISIVWFALKYVGKQDLKRFLVWIFVAVMFHVTAVLSLPIYFMCDKRYKPRVYITWITIGLGINISYNAIIVLLSRFGGAYIAHKLNAYTTYFYTESSLSSLASTLMIRLVILVILWYVIKRLDKKEATNSLTCGEKYLYFNAYFVSIVETIAFASLFILATRGVAALYFCYIPLFSMLVSNRNVQGYKRMILFAISLLFVAHTLTNTLHSSVGNSYIPYTTIFG